jgi:glycogen operon protein
LPSEQERVLGICLFGDVIDEADEWGHPMTGETMLILLNADDKAIDFVLPKLSEETRWILVLDTVVYPTLDQIVLGAAVFSLAERSVVIFRLGSVMK